MVKVDKHTTEHYVCEICRNYFDSRVQAETCEKQKPKKVDMTPYHHTKGKRSWKKGQVVVVRIHDDWRQWRLAVIVGEKIKDHKIFPTFQFLDCEEREYDSWRDEEIIILDNKMKKRIIAWGKIISGRINPSKRSEKIAE